MPLICSIACLRCDGHALNVMSNTAADQGSDAVCHASAAAKRLNSKLMQMCPARPPLQRPASEAPDNCLCMNQSLCMPSTVHRCSTTLAAYEQPDLGALRQTLKVLQGCKAEGQGVAKVSKGGDAEGLWCQGDSQWRQKENWPGRTFSVAPPSAAKVSKQL
jgi:hypothetical protein